MPSTTISPTDTIQALLRAKRTLRLLSDCNSTIVRSANETELLEKICPLIVGTGGYRLVWIGYAQQDAEKRVIPMAQAGCSPDYIAHLNLSWSDNEQGQGPTGRAIRSGETQIARNISQDPSFLPWRARAMTHGLYSSVALPLKEGEHTFAALNIYAHETDAFDQEELLLLEELATNLAYGISVLRLRKAHHQALKARRKQERLCHSVVEQAIDGMAIARLDGTILTANPASCRMTGYSEEELRQRSFCDLVPPGTQPILLPLVAINQSGSRELDVVRKDGSRFPAEIRLYPITLPDGEEEERAVLGVIVDISKRKRDELERHQLQQQALRNAHLATVGVMTAGIVHEVNNPNNAIMFNSTLLANAWKDIDIILHEYYRHNGDFSIGGLPYTEMRPLFPSLIDSINEHSTRIKNIINNMQYISRDEQVAVAEPLDLIKLLTHTASLLKNQISQRTRHFVWTLPETIPLVWGNRQQMEQVFINVILNALHALPDMNRGIHVTLAAKPELDVVLVTIQDEGVGIAEPHLQRLTEPFFSTKLAEGGSGLGLFISNRILENHGGEMHFSSRLDRGTTVHIRLPIMEGDGLAVAQPE
ncbi:MAG: PAS domain S-box protein [Magnetococcales bacterium]|nr:PAS domain S-box protein [Magnetococcales bacterium]